MLVVTRRDREDKSAPPETIVLRLPDGRLVTVSLQGVDRNKALIGVDAPDDIGVLRGELVRPGCWERLAAARQGRQNVGLAMAEYAYGRPAAEGTGDARR